MNSLIYALNSSAIDGSEYVKFTITGSPAECGAEVTSNGTYIRYQNYIRDNDVTNDPTVATRSQVQIGFACEFPVDYRVALPAIMPTVSTVAVQTSRWVWLAPKPALKHNLSKW